MQMRTPLALLVLLLSTPVARASTVFPDAVATELELPEEPACTLCHTTELGKKGTATKPFARSLKLCGIVEKDRNVLVQALRCVDRRNYNSDSDGAADVEEIRDGTDPNRFDVPLPTVDDAGAGGEGGAGPPPAPPPPPPFASVPLAETGCQASPAAPSRLVPFLLLLVLAGARRVRHASATTPSRRRQSEQNGKSMIRSRPSGIRRGGRPGLDASRG